MRPETTAIVVHCSATPPKMDIGAKRIREWHLAKRWRDIGYHAVIRRNGDIELGRDWDEQGAHASRHNHYTIGICLIGGVDSTGKPEANFTESQETSLKLLLAGLKVKYPSIKKIIGHNDLTNRKACPSFSVSDWLNGQSIQKPKVLTA